MPPHWIILPFVFALGACVGSFLNVVVWRLPRGESLVHPPSRCPKCGHKLAWFDNVPVFGWLWLKGKCRYCSNPISPRYPIVEAITGLIFAGYYVALFMAGLGPCGAGGVVVNDLGLPVYVASTMDLARDWILFVAYIYLLASLLAGSLIDAEHFIIPLWLCWLMAIVGVAAHAVGDGAATPGTTVTTPTLALAAAGAGLGLVMSIVLLEIGVFPRSFAEAEPLLEKDRELIQRQIEEAKAKGEAVVPEEPPPFTAAQIRAEMRHEMVFLIPPLLGVAAGVVLGLKGPAWATGWVQNVHVSAGLGALWGGLVGGFVVWLTRVLGSIGFGREAMGMGDVHLMFGVGAILGAVHTTVAFFVAPFFGLLVAVWMLLTRKRRELPYGPYLSLGSAAVLLFHCNIQNWWNTTMLPALRVIFGAG
jgi:leader peptidase (prepilin peptidase)/N-methyltransferase